MPWDSKNEDQKHRKRRMQLITYMSNEAIDKLFENEAITEEQNRKQAESEQNEQKEVEETEEIEETPDYAKLVYEEKMRLLAKLDAQIDAKTMSEKQIAETVQSEIENARAEIKRSLEQLQAKNEQIYREFVKEECENAGAFIKKLVEEMQSFSEDEDSKGMIIIMNKKDGFSPFLDYVIKSTSKIDHKKVKY
jgi:hypothetical protein